MSNSYFNKLRRELRKSGHDYDESDFPTRRQNLWLAAVFPVIILIGLGLSFYVDITPDAAPPVRRPGSTPETDLVQAVMGLLMISPLFYLVFLGLKHFVQVVGRRLVPGRGSTPPGVGHVDGHDRHPGDDH